MAQVTWTDAQGGNWSNVANWSSNPAIPGAADDVLINATPAGYTVSVDGSYTADSIGVIAGVTLTTTYGHVFTVSGLNATSANAGLIDVAGYSSLVAGGSLANSGVVSLFGTSNGSTLDVAGALTLRGGGAVTLADASVGLIAAIASGNRFVNVDNTISGGGTIGSGGLAIDNQSLGVIDATGTSAAMVIAGTTGFSNEGVVEATSSGTAATGGLVLSGVTVDNTGHANGGRVVASGSMAHVDLQNNATIKGGTLSTAAGGVITTDYGHVGTIDGSAAAVTLTTNSLLQAGSYSSLDLVGVISNHGTIFSAASSNQADLVVAGATVTLSGGGLVSLNDQANGLSALDALASGNLLVNVDNRIVGAGTIGGLGLAIDNRASGTIDASGTNHSLVLTGSSGFRNGGLLEATASGGLEIRGIGIADAGTVAGAGGTVSLENATITGGTLSGALTSVYGYFANTLDGTGGITNAGTVSIASYSALALVGTLVNKGVVAALGGSNQSVLVAASSTVTLTGGGHVTLNDEANGNSTVDAAGTGDLLRNVDNLITGAGTIGYNGLAFDNKAAGTIDATGTLHSLVLTGGSGFSNEGLIEATASGGLEIRGTAISNTGKVQGIGGTVSLENASIVGGTVAGAITTVYGDFGNTLDGTLGISNSGTVAVANYSSLNIAGTLFNTGTVVTLSGNNQSVLIADSATVTLTGSGHVKLTDEANGNSTIDAAGTGDVLLNVNNVITGAGTIGLGGLVFDNQIKGTIDATGTLHSLVLAGSSGFTNEGLIESTSSGGLEIRGIAIGNTGTIQATGPGKVVLENATISGGALAGSFTTVYGDFAATLDGSTASVTSAGTLAIANYSSLNLLGSIANKGTVATLSANNQSVLVAASSTVTLTGTGHVKLNDESNGNSTIDAGATGDILLNVDNVITGAGTIGLGGLVFDNQIKGTIDATGRAHSLVLTGSAAFTNEGLIESTASGALEIRGITIANTGTIKATAGNVVYLENATLAGGTTNGSFLTQYGQFSAALDGSTTTVTNYGTFSIANYSALNLAGTVSNKGTISALSASNQSELVADAASVTLTGAGHVRLNDEVNGNSMIAAAATGERLVNVNNVITGAGSIGVGGLVFDNQVAGTIDATGTAHSLVLVGSSAFLNEGLIETTTSGGLEIRSAVTNAGTIAGLGAGVVTLENAAIAGGTLAGAFTTVYGQFGSTLDGSAATLTNAGTFTVASYSDLSLLGAIRNTGLIALQAAANPAQLLVGTTATLLGGGTVALADNANAYVTLGGTAGILVNAGNTILGGGTIGDGGLNLDNRAGVIDASGTTTLVLDLTGTLTNEAVLEATGAGGLSVQNATLTNAGTILANGGNVTVQAGTTVTNLAGTTLTGGTWGAAAGATLAVAGGPVVTDAATISLSGAGSAVTFGGTAIEASLVTVAAGGALDVLAGRDFAAANTLTDNGLILLGGGTLSAPGTIAVAGTLAGHGTVTAPVVSTNLLDASGGGTLALVGAVTATGTLEADAGTVLQLDGAPVTSLGGAVILSGAGSDIDFGTASPFTTIESSLVAIAATGTLALLGSRGYAGATTLTDSGQIRLSGGTLTAGSLGLSATGTLSGTGAVGTRFANAGLVEAIGGSLSLAPGVTGAGTLEAASGATLNIVHAIASAGTVIATGTLLLAGGNLTANGVAVAASGRVTGKGTLAGPIANAGLIDANTGTLVLTGSITGPGTLQAGAGAVLQLASPITTVTGKLVLNGVGSVIQFGTHSPFATLESSVAAIAAGGTLAVLGGRGYATANTITDSGLFTLAGGTLSAGGLGVATGTIAGFGVIATTVTETAGNDSGSVVASGGVLKLAGGAVLGSGAGLQLSAVSGATLELAATTTAYDIGVAGVAQLDGGATTAAHLTTIAGGGRVVGSGTLGGSVADAGTLESSGGLLKITGGLTGTGTAVVDAGSTLELAGTAASGTATVNGVLQQDNFVATFGTIAVGATGTITGRGSLGGNITSAGQITAAGGLLNLTGNVVGAGALGIAAAATLELHGGTKQTVTYGGVATLKLDSQASFGGALAGLVLGDVVTFTHETVTSAAVSGGTLTVVGSAGTVNLAVSGALAGNHFAVSTDHHSITLTTGAMALARPVFLADTVTPVSAAAPLPTEVPVPAVSVAPSLAYVPPAGAASLPSDLMLVSSHGMFALPH